jgi:hypothetical protein
MGKRFYSMFLDRHIFVKKLKIKKERFLLKIRGARFFFLLFVGANFWSLSSLGQMQRDIQNHKGERRTDWSY